MTRLALAPLALVLAGAPGCAPSSDPVVTTRSDSAGVELVVNAGGDRPLDWTFRPLRTLGGADRGPEAFYELSGQYITTDGAGRIYVLDPSAFRVVAFDSGGRYLWSAGTQGEGPGELSTPIALMSTADGVVSVVDGSGMKIEHFDSTGRYTGGERIGSPPWMSQFGRSDGALVVDERPVLLSSDPRERLLLIAGADTSELAAVPLESPKLLEFEDCPVRVSMPPIFGAELHWAASGTLVAAVGGPEYSISLFERARHTRTYRRDLRPVPSTPELAAAQVPDGMPLAAGPVRCEISSSEAVEKRGFGSLVPLIRGLAIAPDGTLWVQRTRAESHRAGFDVLAPDGSYLGSLHDAPTPVDFMPDGSLIGIETDDLDVDRIVIYEVERG